MRLGDKGPAVRAWQEALRARGYRLVVDGVFGRQTHNATLAVQASRGLPTTGQLSELQIVEASTAPSIRPPPVLEHSIPYIEAKHHGRSPRAVLDVIVLHCMEADESSTTAEACSRYFATLPPEREFWKSAHYCIDSDSVVQCVPDHLVAYGAPGCNARGLHLELAGYARQSRAEWLDDFGQRMLWLGAQLVARKARENRIPLTFLRASDLLRPGGGITTHCECSRAGLLPGGEAFKGHGHTDPGPGFPMDYFVDQVELALDARQGVA
jgi:hypothetical protein